jgi:hypothetical protein
MMNREYIVDTMFEDDEDEEEEEDEDE